MCQEVLGSLALCPSVGHTLVINLYSCVSYNIHLYKEAPVTIVECDFTEFYQRLRKHEGRINESLEHGNES